MFAICRRRPWWKIAFGVVLGWAFDASMLHLLIVLFRHNEHDNTSTHCGRRIDIRGFGGVVSVVLLKFLGIGAVSEA